MRKTNECYIDLKEKCEKLNVVDWHVAFIRRTQLGWSEQEAISIPVFGRKKNDDFYKKYGVTKKEYCEMNNIHSYSYFCSRIARGMSVEEASKPKSYFLAKRKTKPIKHWVFYKGQNMPMVKAFKMLCEETNALVIVKGCSVVLRAKRFNQTLQQAFDHYVKLYWKKYARKED